MKITVIGAGVIGLTSAIRLLESGHQVEVLAREIESGTTSHKAAAIWFPFHVAPVEKTNVWGEETLKTYRQEDSQGVPGLKSIEFRIYSDHDSEQPYWMPLTDGGVGLSDKELPQRLLR